MPMQSLLFGHCAILMKLLTGEIFVAKGAHKIGQVVPQEWSGKYPLRRPDTIYQLHIAARGLLELRRRFMMERLLWHIDLVILHVALPHQLVVSFARGEGPGGNEHVKTIDSIRGLLKSRVNAGCGICLEACYETKIGEHPSVVDLVGHVSIGGRGVKKGFYAAKVKL